MPRDPHKQKREQKKDKSEENLRGKLRSLEKQLEQEKRKNKSLEKALLRSEPKPKQNVAKKTTELLDKDTNIKCANCGKSEGMSQKSIWSPNGDMFFNCCSLCKNNERIK